MPILISDKNAIKKYYKNVYGKELNLDNPVLFSEKINWYKLNGRNLLMQTCADKYTVREYIKECGYPEILNDLLGVYDSVSDINLNNLPNRFVLKASHGSHMNVIVHDKSKVNWFQQKLMMRSWLRQNIYWSGREWVYKDIPRRIIAEKYLEDKSGSLRDYKIGCFNGIPKYFYYDIGRFGNEHYRNYYDMNMNLIPVHDDIINNPNLKLDINKETLNKMSEIASVLSKPFQFARIDFYEINGKIYFGEITFFQDGGNVHFQPPKYDKIFGDYWNINQ